MLSSTDFKQQNLKFHIENLWTFLHEAQCNKCGIEYLTRLRLHNTYLHLPG